MNYLDKIDRFCEDHGYTRTDIERDAGLSRGLLTRWFNFGADPNPTIQSLNCIARVMGLTVSQLLADDNIYDGTHNNIRTSYHVIPVLDCISSGDVLPGQYDSSEDPFKDSAGVLRTIVLPDKYISADNYFGLIIHDNSMAPDIQKNDTVIVRVQDTVENGATAIIGIGEDPAVCAMVFIQEEGFIIQTVNKNYPPAFFDRHAIETLPVTIIGKVLDIRREIGK